MNMSFAEGPTPDDFARQGFLRDRETPGNWRVERMDEDGGYEVVKVFTSPDAREQAIFGMPSGNSVCLTRSG
jgi:hypothetical protein